MAEFWIDPVGSNVTGDGSKGNPWATLQFAHDSVSAGDTIKVKDGTYNSALTSGADLTISKNITISGFSDGNTEYPIFKNENTLTGDFAFIQYAAGTETVLVERIIFLWNGTRNGNRVGGIRITGSGVADWDIRNVVIVANTDPGLGRAGIQASTLAGDIDCTNVIVDGFQDCFFLNANSGQDCINCVALNASQIGFRDVGLTDYSHTFNNATDFSGGSQGSNNTSGDPFFIASDSPDFNYRLQYATDGFGSNNSSLVDSGDTSIGTDFNRPPGRNTTTIDKGAYGGPHNGDPGFPITFSESFKDSSGNGNTLGIVAATSGEVVFTLDNAINGQDISNTKNLIKQGIGHVRDFSVSRNANGNDIVTVECQGFESFLKDTLNQNYPDKFDYWALDYAGKEFTATTPDGIDFPNTYDQWPIEDAFKSLLMRGTIDTIFFKKKKQHLSVSGTAVSGTALIERSVPRLTLERARNYGNPGLAVVTFREEDGDIIPVLPDDEYNLKSNFGDTLFDYVNKVIEPYGWDWGSKPFYDGGFYLRTRNNPTDIIGTKSITFDGPTFNGWSQDTDLDAVSGTYQVTSGSGDFGQFSFFGERLDAVLALSNVFGGGQARVANGTSTTIFTTQESEGDAFAVGNRLILSLPNGTESSKITSITSNQITVDPAFSVIPVSGTLIRTAVASYNIVRGTQYVEEDTIVSGFLPSYHPRGFSDSIYKFKISQLGAQQNLFFTVSGTRRLFYQGFDRETALNPCLFNLANNLTRDNHIIRITRLDDVQAGVGTELRLNALFIYDENRVFPRTTFHTGETLASGTITDLNVSNFGSELRNDVTVVGRRVGAIVPGGFGSIPANPNNPLFNHFVSRAVDVNSIINPNAKNFIGRPLQTMLIDPDITSQDRADFWAVQFMNRFRFPGVDAQFRAVYNPQLEIGDAIYIEDTKKDSINNDNVVFIESKKINVGDGFAIDSYDTTTFPPWESLVPKTPVDIADFNNQAVQNVEFIPNTSDSVNDQYDPYRSDNDGTVIQIKYDLVISGFVRIEVIASNGTKVANLLNIDGKDGTQGWLQDTAGKNKLVTWDGVDQFGVWNESRIEKEAGLAPKGSNWFVAEDALVATDVDGNAIGKFFIKFTIVDDSGTKFEFDTSQQNTAPNDFIYTKRGPAVTLFTVMSPSFVAGTPGSGSVQGFADESNDGNGLKFNIATNRLSQLSFSVYRKAYGFVIPIVNGNQVIENIKVYITPAPEYKLFNRQEFVRYTDLNEFFSAKDLFTYDDFRSLFKPEDPDIFVVGNNDALEVYIAWYFVFRVIATDKSGRSSVDTFVNYWEGPVNRTTNTPPDFLKLQLPSTLRKVLDEDLGIIYTNLVRTIT